MSVEPALPPMSREPAASRSSFYTAMRILPAAQRDAMYQVYAFCRAVDDIADEGGARPDRIAGLNQWRADIAKLYDGRGTSDLTRGLTHDLAAPIAEFKLRQADFMAVIDGMEMDARGDIRAPDWATLDLYCDRVASAVGRLSVKIFGVEDQAGIALAHHLGRALQLTNILRDLDEDADMGRLYLPSDALLDADITDHTIDRVMDHPNLDAACLWVAHKARAHFIQAEAIMAREPRAGVRSPRVMASVYRGILEKLMARGWAAPRLKASPSKRQVVWAVMRHGLF